MPSSTPWLTAAVGGGGAGGQLSMRALAASDRFELVAAADLRPEVCAELERLFPGIRTFPNHRELFAACPTDVVCVSTFPPSHEEVALAALRLPLKGILVEKPLGHTAASGRRITRAVRDRGLPMAVPHGLLALKAGLEMARRVHAGEIGDLKLMEIQCSRWDIINAGIHWLNFFVLLTRNEPIEYVMGLCDARTRTYRDGMQVETIAVTYAQTRSGIRVVMNSGDDVLVNREGKGHLFRIVGTAGQIVYSPWESTYEILNAAHPEGATISPGSFAVSGHQRHLERLADEVESGRPDYAVAESSLLALEICEAAYLSSRLHCQVNFPLETFVPPPAVDWDPGQPYSGQGGGCDGRKL